MRSKLRAPRVLAATAVAAALSAGSVLGLAIVRQVADQHHATVTVETPADGGTRMRLRFP